MARKKKSDVAVEEVVVEAAVEEVVEEVVVEAPVVEEVKEVKEVKKTKKAKKEAIVKTVAEEAPVCDAKTAKYKEMHELPIWLM